MRGCAAQPFPWRYASTVHTAVQGDMPRLTTRGAFARVMRPIAAMCVILHCRAYVRVYASHCGHVRDSALLDVCTRLCVPLRPCARFCIIYAFMRPIATLCTILRRAYVHAYAFSCGHVRDSASPGVCTRLCVLLRPCARFCAGRMYAFMRPLATERAILRRAYVRAYACALPRCRALANTSASPCAPLRLHAPAKTKTSSRAHRIRTSARAKCPRVCPCGR